MKTNLILLALLSLTIFAACDKQEAEPDFVDFQLESTTVEPTHTTDALNAIKADFKIINEANTLSEQEYLEIENNSVNAVSYHWDFGNGDTSTDANPNYRYNIHGYYDITLTITDIEGNVKQASDEILVLCVFGGGNHNQ